MKHHSSYVESFTLILFFFFSSVRIGLFVFVCSMICGFYRPYIDIACNTSFLLDWPILLHQPLHSLIAKPNWWCHPSGTEKCTLSINLNHPFGTMLRGNTYLWSDLLNGSLISKYDKPITKPVSIGAGWDGSRLNPAYWGRSYFTVTTVPKGDTHSSSKTEFLSNWKLKTCLLAKGHGCKILWTWGHYSFWQRIMQHITYGDSVHLIITLLLTVSWI